MNNIVSHDSSGRYRFSSKTHRARVTSKIVRYSGGRFKTKIMATSNDALSSSVLTSGVSGANRMLRDSSKIRIYDSNRMTGRFATNAMLERVISNTTADSRSSFSSSGPVNTTSVSRTGKTFSGIAITGCSSKDTINIFVTRIDIGIAFDVIRSPYSGYVITTT